MGHRVHSGSLAYSGASSGSFGGVVFIRVCPRGRWVHSVEPWGFLGFIQVRPGGRRVHLVSFSFILDRPGGRWVHWESLGSLVVIQRRWIHSGVPWQSLGSIWVVVFILVRPGGRWVHSGSLGSFRCALRVIGFIKVRPAWSSYSFRVVVFFLGRCVNSESLSLFRCAPNEPNDPE